MTEGFFCGLGQRSWYSNSLQAGWSGDQIPVGGESFCTHPDRPWGPPNLPYNECRVISVGGGQSSRGVALANHPHLVPRLKKEQSHTSTPPLGLYGLFQGEIYQTLYFFVFLPISPSNFDMLYYFINFLERNWLCMFEEVSSSLVRYVNADGVRGYSGNSCFPLLMSQYISSSSLCRK